MFSYIKGKLTFKAPTQAVIEAGPVGYEVMIPLSTFDALPEINQPITLLTHFHVREDAQQLFGFVTRAERDVFRLLVSVSGIGPRSALTILSGISVKSFRNAIMNNDTNLLTSISGVGRKTADRIVLELREKVGLAGTVSKPGSDAQREEIALGDAVGALVSLGYRHNAARQAIQKVMRQGKDVTTEELVRKALKVV